MPGQILTPPQSGLFGKLPATGDFVARGLPEGFRRSWDAWVTRHLALRNGDLVWPKGGLRFRLVSGGRVAAGVILRSQDSAGRVFPLSLVLIADTLPDPGGLEAWLDHAARAGSQAIDDFGDADWLWQRLEGIGSPEVSNPEVAERSDALDAAPSGGQLLLWTSSAGPFDAAPGSPAETLDRLLPLSSG